LADEKARLKLPPQVVEELELPSCAFMERSYLEWIYIGPVLLLLGTNSFFLVSIFYVVVTKLRSTGTPAHGDMNGPNCRKENLKKTTLMFLRRILFYSLPHLPR
jgi:hypothetical protein